MAAIVLTNNLVLSVPVEQQTLDYPRLCFENLIDGAVIETSGESDEFNYNFPENVCDGNTFDYWQPDTAAGAYFIATFASVKDIDYIGFAAHNLGSKLASFTLEYWNGAGWVSVVPQTSPENDDVIVIFFDEISTNKIRVTFDGNNYDKFSIGVMSVGKSFIFERKIYGGHSPITLSPQVEVSHLVSENGYDLGRVCIPSGVQTEVTFKNLTAAWVRSKLLPIVETLRTKPFFFAWRPSTFQSEVAYVWTDDEIKPTNTGSKHYVSLGFTIKGILNAGNI